LTGATLNQPIGPGGIDPEALANYAPVADSAIPQAQMDHIRNVAVNNLMEKLMEMDDNYPTDNDPATLKAYRARVRRHAFRTLIDQAAEEQARTMTNTDLNARRAALVAGASAFVATIMTRAQATFNSNTQPNIDVPGLDLDEDLPEGNENINDLPAEGDLEDADPAIAQAARQATRGEEFDSIPPDARCKAAATAFMEIIEQNLMSKVP